MTSLAAQLSQIAAASTNSLNLKAQKTAHAQSLIFEPRVAGSQDFDTIYAICREGFDELCQLDARFLTFSKSIFSDHSKREERTQMTGKQNEKLDKVLEEFLALVSARLLLKPGLKAVEWLIRRFRIHEYNIEFTVLAFLPYYSADIFTALLSILPEKLSPTLKFLFPYKKALSNPPRHAIIYALTNNYVLCSALNNFVTKVNVLHYQYPALMSFWASAMTEAIIGMMDTVLSGRHEVQRQKVEDILMRILPLLNQGLSLKNCPELRTGCYMIIITLAVTSVLGENVLNNMMEAVVEGWTRDTETEGLACLAALAEEKDKNFGKLPSTIVWHMSKIPGLTDELVDLSHRCRVDKLALGLSLGLLDGIQRIDPNGFSERLNEVKAQGLVVVESILNKQLLLSSQAMDVIQSILQTAQRDDLVGSETIGHLAGLIGRLAESQAFKGMIEEALEASNTDINALEMRLQIVVRLPHQPPTLEEDVNMVDANSQAQEQSENAFEKALAKVPKRTTNEVSFLAATKSHIYPPLSQAFLLAATPSDFDKFASMPIFNHRAPNEAFTLSFFIRIWCGPDAARAKSAALRSAKKHMSSPDIAPMDFQGLLPYILGALADSSDRVRSAASELTMAVYEVYKRASKADPKHKGVQIWGLDDIYGKDNETKSLKWLNSTEASKFLEVILVPSLEACVLDSTYVFRTIGHDLASKKSPRSSTLKSSVKSHVITFLISHITHTPLYNIKSRLLMILSWLQNSRPKALLQVLENWKSLSESEVERHCEWEKVEAEDMDKVMVGVVSSNDDGEGLELLKSIILNASGSTRPTLMKAALQSLRPLWMNVKTSTKVWIAEFLIDFIVSEETTTATAQEIQCDARDLLRKLCFSSDVLSHLVDQFPVIPELRQSASKRRRTSSGVRLDLHSSHYKEVEFAIRKATFIMELVESSQPEGNAHMLEALFEALSSVHEYASAVGTDLGYLHGLILNSLLATVDCFKGQLDPKFDRTVIRVDLLVDCIRSADSPQMQNVALLLVAKLAAVSPETVLHGVMPIFTFMSKSLLRRDDDYSAHVIDQTIHQVVPPLVGALRSEKDDPVAAAAELLLSFVAAYEHVPTHRRLGLFTSLVKTLGPKDFLFAVLAMLAEKFPIDNRFQLFTRDLFGKFDVETQLVTAVKYLELTTKALEPSNTLSEQLLGLGDLEKSRRGVIKKLLSVLSELLASRGLVARIEKKIQQNGTQIRDMFGGLLEQTLGLGNLVRNDEDLLKTSGVLLESVLGLLSTIEFVKSIESLLDRPDEEVRYKVLKSLEVRIEQEKQVDLASRTAFLGLVPQVTSIISGPSNVPLRHTAISCIELIANKYGKKDPDALMAAAEVICGQSGLSNDNERIQLMSCLCLVSITQVIGHQILPALPQAFAQTIALLHKSIDRDDTKLHEATWSFLDELITQVPWMFTKEYLSRILTSSHDSARTPWESEDIHEHRLVVLSSIAKHVESKRFFEVVLETWSSAYSSGIRALKDHINLLDTHVQAQPKSVIVKHAQILTDILIRAFDLRTSSGILNDEEVDESEDLVIVVAINIILKLNDATFRPIFISLLEWATAKTDMATRDDRLISFYNFLNMFLERLKSIVTSYYSYVLDSAVEILQRSKGIDPKSKRLLSIVLHSLSKSFSSDQDEFWQAPDRFNKIAPVLLEQLSHTQTLPVEKEVIPVIVELAAAAESSDHHKEIHSSVLKHMRSEDPAVRLMAVKCEQQLVLRLGEEWLAMLPEMLPFISELQEDDDEVIERETHRLITHIEGVLGEPMDTMLQ